MDADADAKTTAFNIADMGLEEEDPTVAVEAKNLRATRAPAAPVDEDKTTALNLADMNLDEEEPKRPASSTLVGHPGSKPGAAVRGGAAPAKRSETLALAPSAARPGVPAHQGKSDYDEDKTSALSLDDLKKYDPRAAKGGAAAPARPAASPAPARAPQPAPKPAQAYDEEKTSAMSLDDVEKIDALRARPAAKPVGKAPMHLEESERTMAVPLDEAIASIDAIPPKKPAAVAAKAPQAARPAQAAAKAAPLADQSEKTTAMSAEDAEALVEAQRQMKQRKAPVPETVAPVKAKPVASARAAAPSKAASMDMEAAEGFVGAIGYAFKHDALEKGMESGRMSDVALDPSRKTAGIRNLIIVGGAIAALMLVFGIIW